MRTSLWNWNKKERWKIGEGEKKLRKLKDQNIVAETDESLILFLISVQTQAALLLHGTENPSSFYFIALPSLKCGFLSQFKTAALALAIMSVYQQEEER